jgi:Tol biopolymer transport system component
MQNRHFQAVLFLTFLAIPAIAQTPNEPVVAYVSGTTLTLAASSGQVTQKIELNHPVYDFTLSTDRKLLVTVSPDTEHGGNLSLLDLRSHTQTQLTNGHLYFRHLNEGETEVYADLRFSPDNKSIAFGIHGNMPGDGNDAEENSGPFAVYDIASHTIRVLKSTANIDGHGPCSENNPMWSPDGKWILFNCEDGAFLTDALGTTLRNLKLSTDQDAYTYAVSWVGNGCVLYVQSHTNASSLDQKRDGFRLLNLRTSKSQISAALPKLPKQSLAGLRESSDEAAIMESSSGVTIETREKVWTFPEIEQVFDGYRSRRAPAAHIIGGWKSSSIPSECK